MKILCNKTTKKIEGFSRWDDLEYNANTHVLIAINYVPDFKAERLNSTEDGLRPATQAELDTAVDTELDDAAIELDDPKKAHAAILELLWDNIPELQISFPNPQGKGKLKQAAVTAYRNKL